MKDEGDAEDRQDATPALDPGQDARLRALLAELGSGPDGDAMPPEVAARLEDTLARLVAERGRSGAEEATEEAGSGTVVPLRRRWLPRATAAAAAVVVIGAGGVAAANLGVFGGSSHNAGSTAGGASDSQAKSSTGDTAPSTAPSGSQSREALGAAALPELRAGSFASDVSSLLHRRTALSAPGQAPDASSGTTQKSPGSQARQRAADSLKNLACPGPRITDGALPTPVRYDGRLAVLVVHPERGGHQLVEAWDCRGDRRLTDATITP